MKNEEVYSPGDKVIYSIVRPSIVHTMGTIVPVRGIPVCQFFVSFFFVPRGKERGRVGCRRSGTALYDTSFKAFGIFE